MGSHTDLAALKDIPGYRAILKTVLKSQIQLLIEQLAENTGEESIILTASVNDGSLCHLGSDLGKSFLDGRDEIKSQFLGFCLKGHHQQKQNDLFTGRGSFSMPQLGSRRPRIRPHPYSMSPTPHTSSNNRTATEDFPNSTQIFTKTEDGSGSNSADNFLDSVSDTMQEDQVNFPSSVNMSHTQTSSHSENDNHNNQTGLSGDDENQSFSNAQIKLEPVCDDLDDDVRIVESGENTTEGWGQGDADNSDPANFSDKEDMPTSGDNVGGVAFPGLDTAHHDIMRNFPDLSPSELKQVLYTDANRFQDNGMFEMSLQAGLFSQFSPVRARMGGPRKGTQYWCTFCNKSLQNKALYEYHLRAHSGVKPYECKLCFRKFAGKQVLETHMRLHSGEKPFKCTVPGCDRAFSARSGFDYHIKKHHPPNVLQDFPAPEKE